MVPHTVLILSTLPQMSPQHSVFSLNYIHFVSAGSREMEWEYTCQGKLFLCDLLACVCVLCSLNEGTGGMWMVPVSFTFKAF